MLQGITLSDSVPQLGKLGAPPFPRGRRPCLAPGASPWGVVMLAWSACPSWCPSRLSTWGQGDQSPGFLPWWALEPLWKPGFTRRSRLLLTAQVSLCRCSQGGAERGGASHGSLLVPQPPLPDAQVDRTPPESLGEWCWTPRLSRGTFVGGRMLIFVVGEERN